jgi:hypothetical protein
MAYARDSTIRASGAAQILWFYFSFLDQQRRQLRVTFLTCAENDVTLMTHGFHHSPGSCVVERPCSRIFKYSVLREIPS